MDDRRIEFCSSKTQIDLHQLRHLMQIAAFWAQDRDIADLRIAVASSDPVISAWHGEQLVGFARATSDGVYRAAIWDVIVHPQYQGMGLGNRLMERVFAHPRIRRVERLYLMTTNQREFYRKLGFHENLTTTMMRRHDDLIEQPAAGVVLAQRLPDTRIHAYEELT